MQKNTKLDTAGNLILAIVFVTVLGCLLYSIMTDAQMIAKPVF